MSLSPALQAWLDAGHFINVPPLNFKVFVREFGDSAAASTDTLLLLHGYPESSFAFHKVIAGMQATFARIVCFDMVGYGFSDKPTHEYSYSLVPQADVALQVWNSLGIRGGHVVSHDMGTSVLTELVARQLNQQLPADFHDGLQSITFTNGSMMLGLAKLRVMQKLLLSRLGPIISEVMGYSRFRKTVLSAHGVEPGTEHALSERDLELFWENCVQNRGHRKNHHIIRYLNDRRRYEHTRWLPALGIASQSIPTHFCWGDADQVARIEMAHEMSRNLCPDSTLTVMPGVGHFCQLGSPEVWVNSISSFYQHRGL